MKKSVFTLLALATVSVSVFTSCDKNDDGYAKDKVLFSQSTTNNGSSSSNTNSSSSTNSTSDTSSSNNSSTETQVNNDTVKVTFTGTVSSLEFTKDAPADAGEQLAVTVKNYFQSKVSEWATIDSKFENNEVKLVVNTTKKYELPTMTMIQIANCMEFKKIMNNLGFVKTYKMTLANSTYEYKAKNEYKGTWECTDANGNKFSLKVLDSTTAPTFSSTENVEMTVNGQKVKASVSNTSINVLALGNTEKLEEQAVNAILNSCVMTIKSFSGNEMHVKIEKALGGIIDNDAVFTKVQD